MMKDLIAVFENKPPPTKVPPTFRITPSLPTAKMYNAYCDYIGPTLTHLMIRDGDSVIVYGSVEDSEVLIGYNTRTRMGGRFPANVVGLADTQPEIDYDLVVCITKRTSKASLDKLTYEMGDYVRLCRWENSNRDGYGLNQRTLNFGTFQMCEMRKIPW
jgi:hypothetical protein